MLDGSCEKDSLPACAKLVGDRFVGLLVWGLWNTPAVRPFQREILASSSKFYLSKTSVRCITRWFRIDPYEGGRGKKKEEKEGGKARGMNDRRKRTRLPGWKRDANENRFNICLLSSLIGYPFVSGISRGTLNWLTDFTSFNINKLLDIDEEPLTSKERKIHCKKFIKLQLL